MRYIILSLILMVAFVTMGTDGWDPAPSECDPEEREVAGNVHTPCKRVLPELVTVEHRVVMNYPTCHEEVVFTVPGLTAVEGMALSISWDLGVGYGWISWPAELVPDIDGEVVLATHQNDLDYFGTRSEDYVYRHDDPVHEQGFFAPIRRDGRETQVSVRLPHPHREGEFYRLYSNPMPHARSDASQAMVHACQEQLRQEKANREHAAELARQEAEQDAAIIAQREADRLEQEQAIQEAETQARLAEEELAALQERKTKIAETELIKTQTLETQLQHQEVVAGILREIVRIRLAGEEDRARITNEYLARMEASAADFDVETEEIEARIQAYLDFNDDLLQSIETYQAEVTTRLEEAQSQVAERIAELERIQQEASEETAG